MRRLALLAFIAFFAVSGCAHFTNSSLCSTSGCSYQPTGGYRFNPEKIPDRHTLVVLTISGGGIRASALGYGTLLALKKLPGLEANSSLLDDVDIVSSVSGGSVTAAWFALHGKDGVVDLANSEHQENELADLLIHGGTASLAWKGLNPVTLARYAATDYQRSDALADFFDDRLFHRARYADVAQRYVQYSNEPFVILNATDLGHETFFPFTQGRFDLICSDLSSYRVADAVAASAGFPLVFSPVGIRNFSGDCAGHQASGWPPKWVERYPDERSNDDRCVSRPLRAGIDGYLSNQLFYLRMAREARDYVSANQQDSDLHLLDGGLVDNLGIQSTISLEDNRLDDTPGLYQRFAYRGTPTEQFCRHSPRYGKIDTILYIVVNARSRTPGGIDNTVAPPDLPSTLFRIIDTPIDNTILFTQNYLTAELGDLAAATAAKDAPQGYKLSKEIVTIDFEMIPDKSCRDAYWSLGTSWGLQEQAIRRLVRLPREILFHSPNLQGFYKTLGDDKLDQLNAILNGPEFGGNFTSCSGVTSG